jgi:hypothetical protein
MTDTPTNAPPVGPPLPLPTGVDPRVAAEMGKLSPEQLQGEIDALQKSNARADVTAHRHALAAHGISQGDTIAATERAADLRNYGVSLDAKASDYAGINWSKLPSAQRVQRNESGAAAQHSNVTAEIRDFTARMGFDRERGAGFIQSLVDRCLRQCLDTRAARRLGSSAG